MDLEQYGGVEMNSVEETIEPGTYVLQYQSETEMRNENGWVGIKILFQILGPKHEGRLVSGLFTVANANNPKAVEIGKTELSALANAVGLTNLTNTEDFRGKRFKGVIKNNDNNYPELDSNFGKNFSKDDTVTEAAPKVATKESSFEDDEIPF